MASCSWSGRVWVVGVAAAVILVASLLDLSLNAEAQPAPGRCLFPTNSELARWSFNGTLADISHNQRGRAVPAWDRPPVGNNIHLQWSDDDTCIAGYLRVNNPGYLDLPRVDIFNIPFTVEFDIRVLPPDYGTDPVRHRRILYSDWSQGQWSFLTFLTPQRTVEVWFRNNAGQFFVDFASTGVVPLSQWSRVVVTWNRGARTASVSVNGVTNSYVVGAAVTDINLQRSTTAFFQFGRKADAADVTTDYSPLNSDIRNLVVYQLDYYPTSATI